MHRSQPISSEVVSSQHDQVSLLSLSVLIMLCGPRKRLESYLDLSSLLA